jgi:glycosyltransferase involved in cell wall biosynthesis
MGARRLVYCCWACLLDDASGAAIGARGILRLLAREGCEVEALGPAVFDSAEEIDPLGVLGPLRHPRFPSAEDAWLIDAHGVRSLVPPHVCIRVDGIPYTIHRSPSTRHHEADDEECLQFLQLYREMLDRVCPDVVMGYGGGRLQGAVFEMAQARGIATVFDLHNHQYQNARPFAHVDAVRVPSRFSAEFYKRTLGLECTAIPNPIDPERVCVDPADYRPKFLTFVNPSREKGVYAFARMADELGRQRPDIPILVVESRGSESTLAACGLDLTRHGNVFLMSNVADPRRFYRVTRVLVMPSLWPESHGLVAAEALMNGIPVVASDRGALPETVGGAGILLSLPDRLTPATRVVPTAEEVGPWVEAVIRLWDDPEWFAEQVRRARGEAHRWRPEDLAPAYIRFLRMAVDRASARRLG